MPESESGSQPPVDSLEKGLKGSCVVVDPDESKLLHTGRAEHVRNFTINLPLGAFITGIGRVSPDNVVLWEALRDGLIDKNGNFTEAGKKIFPKKNVATKSAGAASLGELRDKFGNGGRTRRILKAKLDSKTYWNEMMRSQVSSIDDDDEPPSF